MPRLHAVVTPALIALVMSSPLSELQAQRSRESIEGREVSIYNLAGHVRIESGSGSDVTVEISRGGRDAGRLRIATGTIRGRNTLRVIYPSGDDVVYRDGRTSRWNGSSDVNVDSDGTFGDNRRGWRGDRVRVKTSGSGTEAWADLTVRVPSGKSVALHLVAGDVESISVDADLSIDAGSSRVTASNARGRLKIDAGSGSVEVNGATVSELNLDTGSGGVTMNDVSSERCIVDTGSGGVSGAGVSCGSLKVDVGSGGVRLDRVRTSDVNVDAGSGTVTLGLTSKPRTVEIETGSGGVVLGLPESMGAELDIDTGSGGISSDFAVKASRMRRDELRGTIGDGSARIRVSTGSGSVRLRRSID